MPDEPSVSEIGQNLAHAWAGVQTYLAAQAARLRLAIRNTLLLALLGFFAGIIGLSILVSSAVLLMVGLADAIAALLGGRQWAGDLIVGLGVVGGCGLAGYIVVTKMMKASRHQTLSSYEKKKSLN